MKLINEKSSLNISLNVREPLEIDTTPYISKNLLQQYVLGCPGILNELNLPYLCSGATSLLTPETFKFKVLKHVFQLPTMMAVLSNISFYSCLY